MNFTALMNNDIHNYKEIKSIYAISGVEGAWLNEHLTKDCGIVPYLLHKRYGYDSYIVSTKQGDYPYLDTYVKGLKMDFLDRFDSDSLKDYVIKNYRNMDVLIFHGMYPAYTIISILYKKLRPDGKIFMNLDANSTWMDSILIDDVLWTTLLDNCDLIATSCKKMQRHLNIKWASWNIEYLPNGFYNFANLNMDIDYGKKENTIITVGRIGLYVKANHVLMEAFALLYQKLPNWKLKLIGKVEDSFKAYIEEYFIRYPQLKDKVIFTGFIADKEMLWNEYKSAKIFALTSISEGGSPNVAAEAQINGCYMIISDIDASDDITNNEKCGRVFPVGNVEKLYESLLEVCSDEKELEKASYNIIKYAKELLDWNHNIDRLNYMINEKNENLVEGI